MHVQHLPNRFGLADMNREEKHSIRITTSHDNSKLAALLPPRSTARQLLQPFILYCQPRLFRVIFHNPCRVHDYIINKVSTSSLRSKCPVERAKQRVVRQGRRRLEANLRSRTVQKRVYKYVMMLELFGVVLFGLSAATNRLVVVSDPTNYTISRRINIRDHASQICFSTGYIILLHDEAKTSSVLRGKISSTSF